MKKLQFYLLSISIAGLMASCSTNRTFVDQVKSDQGTAKFYIDTKLKENPYEKRLLAVVDKALYYSFYPDKIVKQTRAQKQFIYTLYFKELLDDFDTNSFEKLSATDLIVLSKGSKMLDSLGWTEYKKSNGATSFLVEVNYYHGYPKNKKFKP